MRDFQQLEWNAVLEDDCRQLVRLATREDLDRWHDWTTVALVPLEAQGSAAVVARQPGRVCGLRAARLVLETMDYEAVWQAELDDGAAVTAATRLATIQGRARTLLTAERTLLNFVGHLSGVATLAAEYVAAVAGTGARIYDTRKTTPGWRRLEKYAVRCGGGHNHRTGLFDAILIKDNHLALGLQDRWRPFHRGRSRAAGACFLSASAPRAIHAVRCLWKSKSIRWRSSKRSCPSGRISCCWITCRSSSCRMRFVVGMSLACRSSWKPLGGVNLATVRQIAETGVDRISVGALTHSAVCLDIGLDWKS